MSATWPGSMSEREILQTQDEVPRVWWRYIDDIFAIWTHGEPTLPVFIDSLNHHHPTIKFNATLSAEQVIFLDTRVYLKNGLIRTDLHVKPTDRHQYLRMGSCHPKHCKTAIPYSQALCLRRICLEDENLLKWSCELKKHFLNRAYSEQQLNSEIQ